MFYYLDSEPDKIFSNIKYARKYAVESFPKWEKMSIGSPYIVVYEGNVVGKWEVGVVKKGPGYPVYVQKRGGTKIYRIAPSGDVRAIRAERKKKKVPAPFGL